MVSLALRLVLPLALGWAIPWAAESQAGARVEFADLSLALLAGNLTVRDLIVAQPGGGHAFSRTLTEHNRAVARLRRSGR